MNELVAIALWPIWAITWFAAAAWSRRTVASPGFAAELPYRLVTGAGAWLLLFRPPGGWGPWLWSLPAAVQWLAIGLEIAGFAFCWWARLTLGTLWSGWVTRKQEHRIVTDGPYRFVRHPIYTGLIGAAFATCAVRGTAEALAGAVLLTAGCWIKARLEERFLRRELGGAGYDAYAARTGMLLPLLKRP